MQSRVKSSPPIVVDPAGAVKSAPDSNWAVRITEHSLSSSIENTLPLIVSEASFGAVVEVGLSGEPGGIPKSIFVTDGA